VKFVSLRILVASVGLLSVTGHSNLAEAATLRRFVSSTGNDSSLCTRTAPCRTFQRALQETLPEGEIVVLDSGGYSPVVINQSVTLIAPVGVYAGINASVGETGITISAAGARVGLHGLTINGRGGSVGIHVLQAAAVYVERCLVADFRIDANVAGLVIASGHVFVRDSIFRNNSNGIATPNGATSAGGTFDHVQVLDNTFRGFGLYGGEFAIRNAVIAKNGGSGIHAGGDTGWTTALTVERSIVTGNVDAGIVGDTGPVSITVSNSVVSKNGASGLHVQSPQTISILRASQNTVADNGGVGLLQAGIAILESTVDNAVRGNNAGGAQTSGTITAVSPL
jgi:hypothetical protein